MKQEITLGEIHKAFRFLNPSSRAPRLWSYYGSGSAVRRARCLFCGSVVATCAAAWPETITFRAQADAHAEACAFEWLSANRQQARRALATIAIVDGMRALNS